MFKRYFAGPSYYVQMMSLILLAILLLSTTSLIKFYHVLLFSGKKSAVLNVPLKNLYESTKDDGWEKCKKPQENIVFLKTHKTGSSTITNILNRFAETHNLRVALPLDGFQNFLWPIPFQGSFVKNKLPPPNIVSNHARFSAGEFEELMPKGTKYITILRNPVTQFASLFQFMDIGGLLGRHVPHSSISLEYFLDNAFVILKYLNQHNSQILFSNPSLHLLRNPQLFDLGQDQLLSDNESRSSEINKYVSRQFDLVLIMEYFDESLVLLKRKMCWSINDVVYFKLNQQIVGSGPSNPTIRGKILKWNGADLMLYRHFNETLWANIRNEGPDFWQDVSLLRKRNLELRHTCLRNGLVKDRPYEGSTSFIYGHKLKSDIPFKYESSCKRMVRSEMKYLKYFRVKRRRQ